MLLAVDLWSKEKDPDGTAPTQISIVRRLRCTTTTTMASRPEVSLFKVFVAPDAAEKTSATLTSGYITQGPRVEELEQKLGEFLQNPNTLTLNSATSGLHLALHMLKTPAGAWPGLKPGDEVLTTALTCTATNWPIMANGLKPKWVDVDPKNANINLQDLKYKLSPNTKVIQFVHWGGTPVDLDGIKEVVEFAYERFGFRPMVIEDAAHAIGAEWKGRRIGSLDLETSACSAPRPSSTSPPATVASSPSRARPCTIGASSSGGTASTAISATTRVRISGSSLM